MMYVNFLFSYVKEESTFIYYALTWKEDAKMTTYDLLLTVK